MSAVPNPGLLRSVIGRRLIGQYVGATLTFVALTIVSIVQVKSAQDDARHARELGLSSIADAYVGDVRNRFSFVDTAISVAAAAGGADEVEAALASRVGKELDAVVRFDRVGTPVVRAGNAGAILPLDASTRQLLAGPRSLLAVVEDDPPRIGLWRGLANARGERVYVAAVIRTDYLAGGAGAGAPRADFCILSETRVVSGCQHEVPPRARAELLNQRADHRSAVSWQSERVDYLSSARDLVPQPDFEGSAWTIIATAPASAPMRWVQLLIVLIAAVAAAIVGWTGARHVRRMVVQLNALLAGTQRIAQREFAVAIGVDGGDEIARLAHGFNDMARVLGMNFATLNVLSQIDQTILSKPDVGEVIKSALRCVRYITSVDVVILGLFETEAADLMRIYALRKGGRNHIDRSKLALPGAVRKRIPLKADSAWVEDPPLPRELQDRLRREDGVEQFWVQPIARGDRVWGIMVLCHRERPELVPNQLDLLSGVTDRLEVAFSTVERDHKLHTMAHVDALTGLPNRTSLLALLAQELAHAARSKTCVGVLFLDLDRFKQANDTLGHAIGDSLLQRAAERIKRNVREDDTVARLGGDEFTVVLGNLASGRDSGSIARQLIKALSRPFEIEGHTIYVGASVGIAIYPDDGTDGADLLKKADTAMYRAKDDGRSRFAYFEEMMNVEARRRAALDRELRQAMERDELVLHFQPQIDLVTGKVCSVEALVRWQHPERGLLYPGDFIPFAEEGGLIPEIGAWVMREACMQHQRWRRAGVPIPRVAVNVSNGQLRRANFVRTVNYLIGAAEMPPGSLEIEVTESMFLEGGRTALDALHTLVRAGVVVAIDDFGTGYSSFGYLKTLPATVLKLDKSFLVDAATDNDAGTIIAAMINMAHTLRKEVVAEGVEREDQLEFLRSLGCEKVQGYLFCKALPPDEVAAYAMRRLLSQPKQESAHEALAALATETPRIDEAPASPAPADPAPAAADSGALAGRDPIGAMFARDAGAGIGEIVVGDDACALEDAMVITSEEEEEEEEAAALSAAAASEVQVASAPAHPVERQDAPVTA